MKRSEKLPKNTRVIVNPGTYYRQPSWEKKNGLWTGSPKSRTWTKKFYGRFMFSSPDNGPHSKIVEVIVEVDHGCDDYEYFEVDKCDLNPTLSYPGNPPRIGDLFEPNRLMLERLDFVFDIVDTNGQAKLVHQVKENDIFLCVERARKHYRSYQLDLEDPLNTFDGFVFLCGDKRIHVDDHELDLVERITE